MRIVRIIFASANCFSPAIAAVRSRGARSSNGISMKHQMCEQRYFDDFEVGEKFILPSRTMTEALFAAFQLASGDNHPIHYDVEYCRSAECRTCSRTAIRS
jgi:acyl dehydratase